MLVDDALTTRRVGAPVSRARLLVQRPFWETPPMNVSRMNHAMLSFALIGGMLVGGRQAPKPPVAEPSKGSKK
jgi:hypothetical protein